MNAYSFSFSLGIPNLISLNSLLFTFIFYISGIFSSSHNPDIKEAYLFNDFCTVPNELAPLTNSYYK